MKMTGAFYALLAFGSFATHDAVIKFLGGQYGPAQMIFFATLFSFPLVMSMLIQDKGQGNLRPVYPGWTIVRTLGTTINAMCAFYAFSHLPLAQVYAILFATPLLITILSIPMLGERVGIHRWVAVLIGLMGVLIVLRPFGGTELSLGHLAALACAVVGAFASIIVRKVGPEERTVVLLLYPMMSNFVIFGGLMLFTYEPLPLPDLAGMAMISVLGFAGGMFLVLAYKASEAATVAPMQYSQIIWATIFGVLFFDERPDLMTALGAAVIISSGLYIVFREATGGVSENTPVLRNRSRASTAASFRVSAILRRDKHI